jgi:soluble lytic murein transglycosylase-like protein
MRIWLTAFALAGSAPSFGQTAVTMDFSQGQMSVPGVESRATGDFIENRLGIWRTAAHEADPGDIAAVLRDMPGTTTAPTALPGLPYVDPCSKLRVPADVPGLREDVMRRRLSWWSAVSATECRYGIPAGLLDAVILQESRYQIAAISPKGAIGLAQLMPGTAGDLGVADAFDPASNIDGGGRYLRAQLDRFKSVHLGIAAYNAGPGAVRAARGIPQNSETPDYVRRVLDFWSASAGDPLASARRMAQILGFVGDDQ